ncbi:chemotaxis protein CheW [Pseudomonas sp. S25]|uniref:Chemotaxis protein CheW n=1 Tax=Pseudomonas maioricensis TaxID=1766623 RepID=A0ABS9ZHN6_9PSED|nr:chemotaxis protein CheW [Pseudomonas sp. S25]MCI8210058.1 chemotaxis protein CheW [Pseudomonas sp. S25]
MSELPVSRGSSSVAPKNKLFLLFRIGDERYALEAVEIAEVLPRLPLKVIAQAPHWVVGILAHRAQMIPVIDLAALAFGQSAKSRTSTRLVLVHYQVDAQQPKRLLGLIIEQATDMLRCAPDEFRDYGLDNPDAAYLGPVREDALGLVQWIGIQDLLSDQVRKLLYPAQPSEFEFIGEVP